MRQNLIPYCLLLVAVLLGTGCDGDDIPLFGPGEETEKTAFSGQFLDSAVVNLDYHTPSLSGVTDGEGRFNYRENETVTFAVGKVTLGSTEGEPVVTPINLVSDGSSSTPAVQNITRFLLALDSDDNPRNGITLSSEVKDAANSWAPLDFASGNFETEVADILAATGTIYGRAITLPTASEARQHLEQTVYCAYGGAYGGTFSDPAGYHGQWMLLVDSGTGNLTGILTEKNGGSFQLVGKFHPDAAGTLSADIYPTNTLSPWQGTLSSAGILQANSGSVSGSKKEAELGDGVQGILYKGSLARGNQAEITDIYALTFAVNGTSVTAQAYSLAGEKHVEVQTTWINADEIQFTLDGIDLFAGGISNGDYVTIGGTNGGEQIVGTACRFP